MPGITGTIAKDPRFPILGIAPEMLSTMQHESFYVSGVYENAEAGVSLGWTAHPGSFAASSPAWNASRDVCVVVAGECFLDVPQNNGGGGFGRTGDGTTAAYLVQLYEERDADFCRQLNGWCSGVVVDLRRQRILLFNDRYGLERIYFHETSDALYFSSEAKSLLKVLPALRQVDPQGLAEVVSCGCVLQDRTLFRGVSLLPSGTRWTFARGQTPRQERYFEPSTLENLPPLTTAEFHDRLREVFPAVLQKYSAGPNAVAMSLTGGLDGRMIMAWSDAPAKTLPCYTFGSLYRDCTDVSVARRVARACQQDHQVIEVGEDFFPRFPVLAERAVYFSDGVMDVGAAVELYVNERARHIAPVRLTGNYGSEIMRSNVAFKPHRLESSLFSHEFQTHLRAVAATYADEAKGDVLSFIAFKQVPWHHHGRFSVERSQLQPRSPYLDNALVELMYQAPAELRHSAEAAFRLVEAGRPALARIPTDRGLVQKPVPVWTKLQNQFLEFTFKAEYAFDYGMPQWLARLHSFVQPLNLDELFLGRHKFYHFRRWYRTHFPDYVRAILLDPRTLARPYFRAAALEQIVEDHLRGRRNFTSEIHRALSIELLHRTLIDPA